MQGQGRGRRRVQGWEGGWQVGVVVREAAGGKVESVQRPSAAVVVAMVGGLRTRARVLSPAELRGRRRGRVWLRRKGKG